MQPEVYQVGPISIVPVKGLTRAKLFEGMVEINFRNDSQIKEYQDRTIKRLRDWIPTFVDETVQPSEKQYPNVFKSTFYDVHLEHGKVSVEVCINNDLGERLSEGGFITGPYYVEESQGELVKRLRKRGGVFLAADYHWLGNNRKGLQLRGPIDYTDRWAVTTSSLYLKVFEKALNALCQGADLTEAMVRAEKQLQKPLSYPDEGIKASVRDVSLEAVRAADQPIHEFMTWMQENAAQVNTFGELLILAQHSYLVAEAHQQRVRAAKISTAVPAIVKHAGDQYLKQAQEAYAELHPPQNNRMDYLVH